MTTRLLCLVAMLLCTTSFSKAFATDKSKNTIDKNISFEERGHPNAESFPIITCPNPTPGPFLSCNVTSLLAPTSSCTLSNLVWDLTTFPSMPTGTTATNPNGVYQPGVYRLVWTAIDCDETVFCVVDFTVVDQTDPTFLCPTDLTIGCPTLKPVVYPDLTAFLADPGAIAMDDCTAQSDLLFGLVSEGSTADPTDCPGSITREYFLEDQAGNRVFCSQDIIVLDLTFPTFTTPDDLTIFTDAACLFDASIAITGDVTDEADNCGNVFNATFTDTPSTLGCTIGSNVYTTITRSWSVTDECGNTTIQQQIISVADNIPPTFTQPADITINPDPNPANNCAYDASIGVTGDVTDEADNCGTTFQANFGTDILVSEPCIGSRVLNRVWTLIDNCGNATQHTQVITVEDITPPSFTAPANITIDHDATCNADLTVGNTGDVTDELDNCNSSLSATFTDAVTNNTPCQGAQVITRTWSLMDDCGNAAADQIQIITVRDVTPPSFTAPADITIFSTSSCNFDASIGMTGDVTNESDGCTIAAPFDATFTDAVVSNIPCEGSFVLSRTWSLVDDCGNVAPDQVQTITIQDNTPPSFTRPADITIFKDAMCNHDASISITGDATLLADNCDMTLMATFTDAISSDNPCVGSEVLSRTWSLVDDCGNVSADQIQTITISDITAPTFTAPADLTISCLQDPNDLLITGNVTDQADNCSMTFQATFADNIVPGTCPGMFLIERTWSLMDLCTNVANDQVQMIMVQDLVNPVVTCVNVISGTTPMGMCSATITIAAPTVVESCGTWTMVNDYNMGSDASDTYPVGTTPVMWTVTDQCGNVGTCSFDVIVSDTETPVITAIGGICAVLGGAGTAALNTASIVSSVTDNCGVASVQIARMEPNGGPCNIVGNDVFGETVGFCCSDVGSNVNVLVEAVDIHGNPTQLMVAIAVKEDVDPTATCPSDITLNCEYPLDLTDLSALGTIVIDPATANDIIVNGVVVGTDGVATDNCGVANITYAVDDSGLTCNQGPILRTFTITDNSGNTTSCTQTITVLDDDLFDENDITWPADFNLTDCNNINVDPSITGTPIFPTDKCSQVAASFVDAAFVDPPLAGACPFFLRTWTVLDWCQYISNDPSSPGVWTYVQTITAVNTVAPVFANCADVTICTNETTCIGNLDYSISAIDDCTATPELSWTYSLDLFGNGTTIYTQNDSTLTGNFPQGIHTLTWTVEDNCGNSNTCVQNVTIVDCKAPSVVCINGLSVSLNLMPTGGMVELWASDFDASSVDNCTDYDDLIFSFSSNPLEGNKTFTCADLGQQNVEIWVTDEAGNQAACNTYVLVQDNSNICPTTLTATVSGRMSSETNMGIINTEVSISSNNMNDLFTTDDLGDFEFPNLVMYKDYLVSPLKDDNHINGVSSLDLVLIQKHILGLKELDSPYKMIAADANNSKGISAIDLIQIRKLILGVVDEFPDNNSWRFVPGDYVFTDPTFPWDFVEEKNVQNIAANVWDLDFVAIKIGDVNASAESNYQSVNLSSRMEQDLNIEFKDQNFIAGDELSIPFKTKEVQTLAALQFTHTFDAEKLEFIGIEAGAMNIAPLDYALISDGELTFTWYNIEGVNTEEVLFNLMYRAKEQGTLAEAIAFNSSITSAQAYATDYKAFNLNARFEKIQDNFEVFQNTPNPFSKETAIEIHLSKAESTTLQVYDSQGSLVYKNSYDLDRGINIIGINKNDLKGGAGIYFYEINTGKNRTTQKMIVL